MSTKTMTLSVQVEVSKEARDIVDHLSLGLRPREIAETLGLSNRTIEAKIDQLRADYGCKTPAHLVGVFFRNKLID